MHLVLYQPEIPQNTGTLLRLGACLQVNVHIIEPCGYILNDRRLRRSGMDYLDTAHLTRHSSWHDFQSTRAGRCVLLTPNAPHTYLDFQFQVDDYLILGRESSGVPEDVLQAVDHCIKIPMAPHARSLNVAVAAAMVMGEALRQTQGFPETPTF